MNGDGSPQIAQVTHSQRSHAIRIVQPSLLQHSLGSKSLFYNIDLR